MTDWLLPVAVLAVALLYASVGHAGATGYIAVMGLLGLAPEVIRPTALVLNLVVATIGTAQFARAGHFRRDLFLPLGLASVPAAALGGAWSLPTTVFEGVLGLVLGFSAIRIAREVLGSRAAANLVGEDPEAMRRLPIPALSGLGAGLGLASGLTGVGGGVFLTPLLLAFRVATTRQVAAVSIVFILVNSAAGLGGWLAAGRSLAAIDLWVVAAAAGGGLLGSQAGAFNLPVRWLRLLMAIVLAVASVKLTETVLRYTSQIELHPANDCPTTLPTNCFRMQRLVRCSPYLIRSATRGCAILVLSCSQGFASGSTQDAGAASTLAAATTSVAIQAALAQAGGNRPELEHVLASVPAAHKESAVFLIENMPPRDLQSLKADFLLSEIELAHAALDASPWKSAIPKEIFLNNILPYVNVTERRDPWRKDFRERFAPLIEGAETPARAAALLNQKVFPLVNVKYSTQRAKADQSPSESMQSGLASCTGLSVLLIDACRSLAIPARFVGTPLWSDNSGNHSWVEVWDDGWHFTGAAEPSGDQLDHAWFVGRAATANRDDPRHAIYAVSFQRTPLTFPLVWDRSIDTVSAVNVTDRYTTIGFKVPAGTQMVSFRAVDSGTAKRVVATLKVFDSADTLVAEGDTKSESFDANDHLHYYLQQGQTYRAACEFEGRRLTKEFTVSERPELVDWRFDATPSLSESGSDAASEASSPGGDPIEELKAYLGKPADSRGPLSRQGFAGQALTLEQAQAAENLLLSDHQATARRARRPEFDRKVIELDGLKMPFGYQVFGDKPPSGRSLYISLHGGGGAPAPVNDGQWENQKRLYQVEEGVYVAPRAPTNTWNLWHEGHVDRFLDRLIEDFVLFEDVDSDKVYLMGYSAGGDGVYQLAPRMADRFAAAAMMAGHPNETSPLGLRNLPFAIHMGEQDGAFNRNTIAGTWKGLLADLRSKDLTGYPHVVKLHPGKGHWMDRQDAEALPWMKEFTRPRYPEKIVWKQDDVIGRRFYWLAADGDIPDRALTIARRDGQQITIDESGLPELSIYLRDDFIDCDHVVKVFWNGQEVYSGKPARTVATIHESLMRGDPKGAFFGKVSLTSPMPR
ncbi:MAG: TSUP family transporter [Planctomycetota bacterium]